MLNAGRAEIEADHLRWRGTMLAVACMAVIWVFAGAAFILNEMLLVWAGGSWWEWRGVISLCVTAIALLVGTCLANWLLWIGWPRPED